MASRSSSEYTATVVMPSSRHVRMTRTAISPRLAMRTLLNNVPLGMLWRQVAVSYGRVHTRSHLGTGPVAGRVVLDPRLHEPPRPRRGPGGSARRAGGGRRRADRGEGPAGAHVGGSAGV